MSYTVMGDAVNLTSSLEDINKQYGTQITVSHAIFREVGERLHLRPVNEVNVKGRRTTLQIYELLGVVDVNNTNTALETSADVIEQCKLTKHAYQAFHDKQWKEAALRYETILAHFPNDALALSMLQRCQNENDLDNQDGF
jgi:adenylate cyclase